MKTATAFAPASVANVAVGFDILGFSADVAGDTVTVERIATKEVQIAAINGATSSLPLQPEKNTATAGLLAMINQLNLDHGFRVTIAKGIPFGSGMGGSAASAVAAVVAANATLRHPLEDRDLVRYALIGEFQASGAFHADNVAPSFFGGLTLARLRYKNAANVIANTSDKEIPMVEVVSIPVPDEMHCALIHPNLKIETKSARGLLKESISLKQHIAQSTDLAGFLSGCYTNNLSLIKGSFTDHLVEPQRAHLIAGFYDVKSAALDSGALGASIAGAGPSVFALCESREVAVRAKLAMLKAFNKRDVNASGWAFQLDAHGARIIA